MSSAVYKTKRLDHLGLAADFYQEIDLAAICSGQAKQSAPRNNNTYKTNVTKHVLPTRQENTRTQSLNGFLE
jgi:hypothetical protein